MMKNKYERLEYCPDLRSERLRGTAVTYVVRPMRKGRNVAYPGDVTAFQGDFEFDSMSETSPEQVRARRYAENGATGQLKYKYHELRDEVAILFGPAVSVRDAIDCLRSLAAKLEKDGLMTGKDAQDDYQNECLT